MKKYFLLFLGLCFIMACATAPAPRTIVNAFPVNQPFEKVWTAVIETFSDMNLPIQNMEKASGLVVTDWIDFTQNQAWDRYTDCGKIGMTNAVQEKRGKFNVFVKKVSEESCEVRINALFSITELSNLTKTTSNAQCVSTGAFEADFLKLITDKIK
jgi:uncharacterized lipoprotein